MLDEAERTGLRVAPLDDLARELDATPVPPLPVTTWGTPRDLTTWSGPRARGLAWRQRAAELRAVAAGAEVPERAWRELLALQSSDWAFLISHGTAGDYPEQRAAGHETAYLDALAEPADERARAARSGAVVDRSGLDRDAPADDSVRESPMLSRLQSN